MFKMLQTHNGSYILIGKLKRPLGSVKEAVPQQEYYAVEACTNTLYLSKTDAITPDLWNANTELEAPSPYQNNYIFENYWDAYAYFCKLKKLIGDATNE